VTREDLSRAFGAALIVGGLLWAGLAVWAALTTEDWDYLKWGVFALVAVIAGWRNLFPGEPPPLQVAPDDPIMAQATDQARRDVHKFVDGLKRGEQESLVKYPIRTMESGVEHVWAAAHALNGQMVIVTMMSEPVGVYVPDAARQRIHLSEIEDWMLIGVDGRTEGGYTQIAMAKIYKRDLGYVPYAVRQSLSGFVSAEVEWL